MRVGDQLAGRYRLDRRLGQGGMGEVWRGHDLNLDRAVAVKVLLEAATNDEVVARFRREATIGARLQHPGITVVHDVGQQDGRLFIVMELLAGEDLATMLARDGGLAVDLALDLAAQTAEALAAAHEQAVVHRDLKPANLFLLSGRRLKICDFGIAHSADATAGWTVTGRMFGTPAYMAPEQWRGERVGARCDLYALGCVLYALLSGAPPFGQGEGPYVLMRQHIEEAPLPLREVGAPVSPELDRLVLALLAKDPADRPESAEGVGKTLRGLLTGEPAPARHPAGQLPSVLDAPPAEPRRPATAAAGVVVGGAGDGTDGIGAGGLAGTAGGAVPGVVPGAVPGVVPGAVPGVVPGAVRRFVRDLLRDAEEALEDVPAAGDARVTVLALAADTAARFDAPLAARLLADAEASAWTGGQGDGVRIAALLTTLARATSAHAPHRAERLLVDAQQALFTVPGSDRRVPLAAVARELARIAPERAAGIAAHHFTDGPHGSALRARIEAALAAVDPEEAERQLNLIGDAGRRAAATYDMVLAVAPRDLPAALRLSERIGSAGARLLVLCQVVQDCAEVGDAAGAALALAQAEEELPAVLEERAGWLREEADRYTGGGESARGEELRDRAARLLGARPEAAGDEKGTHALAALAEARARVAQDARAPLDLERARERAELARRLPEAPARARALARVARECVAAGAPWLPAAAADPGVPLPYGAGFTLVREPGGRLYPRAGERAWHTNDTPRSLHVSGDALVWRTDVEVGSVWAHTGAARWTAFADEGAPPAAPAGRATVSCTADTGTVYVAVRRSGAAGVRLVAREPGDGRVRWWRDLPDAQPLRAAGERVLYGSPDGLTALDAANGEPAWTHPMPEGASGALTVADDCLVVADGGQWRGLRLSDGERLWARAQGPAESARSGRTDVLRDRARDLVHVLDGATVRALHRRTGEEQWHLELGTPAARLLVAHDTVYAAALRPPQQGWDVVFALDAGTGRARWERTLTRRDGTDCGLELLGTRPGLLYLRSAAGSRRGLLGRGRPGPPFVAALDLATGRTRWQWEDPALGEGDPVLAGEHLVLPRPRLTAIGLPVHRG